MGEVKDRTADLEDLIVAAYKRGVKWGEQNPDSIEYQNKAARDYADFTISTDDGAAYIVKAANGYTKAIEAFKKIANADVCVDTERARDDAYAMMIRVARAVLSDLGEG